MTNYTDAEKQKALNEANELMKKDAERLEEIKKYISNAIARHTTPILNEADLKFLVRKSEQAVELEGLND